jgi:hypothetical protein
VENAFELWIGDAEIRAKRVPQQKTDGQDAQHILRLLLKDHLPRILARTGRLHPPIPERRRLIGIAFAGQDNKQ